MSAVNFNSLCSFDEITRLICNVGHAVTVVVRAEPGVGKSSLKDVVHEMLGRDKYNAVYIDCPTLNDGDLGMNIPDRETKMMEFMVSSMLRIHDGKPVILMLDEYLKTDNMMKKIFARLILERCIGDVKLPDGSVVFATSNLGSDGLNDTVQGHEGNRVMFVEMAKPDHKRWNVWATAKGLSSLVRSLVALKPQLLQSYRTLSATDLSANPYIYNPSKKTVTYVSPRSLAMADVAIQRRQILGEELTRKALAGVIGEAAANLFATFMMMEKDLIPIPQILAAPDSVAMPQSAGALLMTMFNAVDELQTQDELTKFMMFVNRVDNEEYRDVFMSQVMESKRLAKLAMQNAQISKWYQANYKIM
jgi:hypothetical protein